MPITTKKIELVTANDYYEFGDMVYRVMQGVKTMKCGIYKIKAEDKPYFMVVCGMHEFQTENNRGLRMVGDYRTLKIEIFDIEERQKRLDAAMDDWSL